MLVSHILLYYFWLPFLPYYKDNNNFVRNTLCIHCSINLLRKDYFISDMLETIFPIILLSWHLEFCT